MPLCWFCHEAAHLITMVAILFFEMGKVIRINYWPVEPAVYFYSHRLSDYWSKQSKVLISGNLPFWVYLGKETFLAEKLCEMTPCQRKWTVFINLFNSTHLNLKTCQSIWDLCIAAIRAKRQNSPFQSSSGTGTVSTEMTYVRLL